MRSWVVVCLFALIVRADEVPEAAAPAGKVESKREGKLEKTEEPDPFGFPITFNDQIITEQDVLRAIGGPREVLGSPETLRAERDALLRRGLMELVATHLGIGVEKAEIDDNIAREKDLVGGDAKYYDRLLQRGETEAIAREKMHQIILAQKLRILFVNGISADGKTLLPWSVRPSPREIHIAFENDPERRNASPRARWYELTIKLTRKEKRPLMMMMMDEDDVTDEVIRAKCEEILAPRLKTAIQKLDADGFEAGAKAVGLKIEEKRIEISKEASKDSDMRFLQTAKPNSRSQPVAIDDGWRLLYLIERVDPSAQRFDNLDIQARYKKKIRYLRAQKWRAVLMLRVLRESTVRPERVRDEFRRSLLAELKEAVDGLRAMGLH